MSSIQVAVRVRPFNRNEIPKGQENNQFYIPKTTIQLLENNVIVFDPINKAQMEENKLARLATSKKHNRNISYQFDKVFDPKTTQQTIFQQLCLPLLKDVLKGFHSTIFAYGATGAGKTHTITGTKQDPGLIYRSLDYLFTELPKSDKIYSVQISYIEIYNEQLRDLLEPASKLELRQKANSVTVANMSKHCPKSANDVMQLVNKGNKQRSQSPTEANSNSSRSHAILFVTIELRVKGESTGTESLLSIIDLAGSERASSIASNNVARAREGATINRSLLALGNCINALCSASKSHIPFRDSKLTRLLKHSLSGNCKTVMICAISPHFNQFESTLNTLKYANRAKSIVVSSKKNVKQQSTSLMQLVVELQQENLKLKQDNTEFYQEQQKTIQLDIKQILDQCSFLLNSIEKKQLELAQVNIALDSSRLALQSYDSTILPIDEHKRIRMQLLQQTYSSEMEDIIGQLIATKASIDTCLDNWVDELDTIVVNCKHPNLVRSEIKLIQLQSQLDASLLEKEGFKNKCWIQMDLMHLINKIGDLEHFGEAFDTIKKMALNQCKNVSIVSHENTDMIETPLRPLKRQLSPIYQPENKLVKKVSFDLDRNSTLLISPRANKIDKMDKLLPSPSKL